MKHKLFKRYTAVIMSLMIALAFMPAMSYAASGETVNVFMTISDHGGIAADKHGYPMAWKEVAVSDVDGDGHYTFDEALSAAHELYCAEGTSGMDIASSGWVNKLWGSTDPAGCSFMRNNVAERDLETETEIKDGDHLVASLNQDEVLYSDWNTYFDSYKKDVTVTEKVTLTLEGYQAMTVNDPAAVSGVKIGVWKDGGFSQIDSLKTDENGKVEMTFDEAGTYIVTAQGSAKDTVDAEALYVLGKCSKDYKGNTIYGRTNWSTGDTFIGYTVNDYGEGSYPWGEIKWFNFEDYDDDLPYDAGHLLYSGNVLYDCPIITPVCIINVKSLPDRKNEAQKEIKAYVTENKGKADKAELALIVSGAIIDINAAKSAAEIDEIINDAKTEIDKLVAAKTLADAKAKVQKTQIKGLKVTAGKKKATVKWTKNAAVFAGYQIQYKKAGAKAKTVLINNKNTAKKVIKKLAKGKKYTFKVRGFKKFSGKKVFGKWSAG